MGMYGGGGASIINGLLGGLVKGQVDSQRRKEQSELRKEKQQMAKLQVEKLKLDMEAARMREARAQRQEARLEKLLGGGQGQGADAEPSGPMPATGWGSEVTPSTGSDIKLGQSFGQQTTAGQQTGGGIVDQLASMSPLALALLKKETGVDTLGAAKLRDSRSKATWKDAGGRLVQVDAFGKPTGKTLDKSGLEQVDLGDRILFLDKNGTPVQTILKAVKREGVDVTGPGGTKTRTYVNPYSPPGTIQTQSKKPKTAESAGKVATLKGALKNFDSIYNFYVNPDGSVNKKGVMSAGMGLPGSKGREVYAKFMEALDAKIRAMTGAAITKEEVPFYTQMYLPSMWDNDSTVKDKLQRLERFLRTGLEEMAPGEAVKAKGGAETPIVQAPQKKADYVYVPGRGLVAQ